MITAIEEITDSKTVALEARIAEALAVEMNSAELGQILDELEAALPAAEARAKQAHVDAMDLSIDRATAKAALDDAEIAWGRLRTAHPRLRDRFVAGSPD